MIETLREVAPILAMAGTAVGTLLTFWISKRKGDVDHSTAILTGAETTVMASQTVVEMLVAQTKRQESAITELQRRFTEAERRFRSADALIESFARWVHWVVTEWEELRGSETPPMYAEELADVINRINSGEA